MEDEYTVQTVTLKEHENKGSVSFNVKRTGVYFVVAISYGRLFELTRSCDYRIGTVHFEGSYETINPFGQLPAPLYLYEAGRFNEYVLFERWRQSKHGTQDIPQTISVYAT